MQDRAESNLSDQNCGGCTSKQVENSGGRNYCPKLEHEPYDAPPNQNNNHCLFLCFADILRERNKASRPESYQDIRNTIADFFDQHDGTVTAGETTWTCDEDLRTNGIGGVAEVFAFATIFAISIEVRSSDTHKVHEFRCGTSDSSIELLFYTKSWQDHENLYNGGHWCRMNQKCAAGSETSSKHQANGLLSSANWRRCALLELDAGNCGSEGDGFCTNLEHDLYKVVPTKRDGDCLFHCFWTILQDRAPEALPCDIKSLRSIIADFVEHNDNHKMYNSEGFTFQCEDIEAIRSGADATGNNLNYGSLTEVFAFSKIYSISVSVLSPETIGCEVVKFDSGNTPELLLQTLGWENEERRRGADHWQRLQQRKNEPRNGQSIASFSPSSVMQKSIDIRKTHRKLDNPRNFPLPRSDTVILRERVFLEENKKSIKERLMQLSVATNNDVELAYTELVTQSVNSNVFEKTSRLPGLIVWKGVGSSGSCVPTVSFTKKGRGEFKCCLRVDVPKSSVPAVKLVLCFRSAAERSRWHDAFLWAENRANICRKHVGYELGEQQAAAKLVETAMASLDSRSHRPDESASNDALSQDIFSLDSSAFTTNRHEEERRRSDNHRGGFLHRSRDLTPLVHQDRKTLHTSDSVQSATAFTVPIEILDSPCSQPVVDQMVSLVHSSIRRTLGHFSEAEELFPILEHALCTSVKAIWSSPSDFVGVSIFTRSRWIASVAQAILFLHKSHIAHDPFDLDTSISFNDSNCKLLVIPQNGVNWFLNAEHDLQFIVSFAEKVIMSHPDRLSALTSESMTTSNFTDGSSCDCSMRMLRNAISDSGRMVGGIPVSSYNSEFDVVINDAFNHRADASIITQAWLRICGEMSKSQIDVPSFHDVTSLLFWQEHLFRKAFSYQVDDQSRHRRRAIANDPNRFIFSSFQDDPCSDSPIFNEISDIRTPPALKKELLVMLLSFVQSIPENRSLYLEAGFFNHFLLCMHPTLLQRPVDDQLQEFCLLVLSNVLGAPTFLTSSWNCIDEQRQAEEVCKKVCEVLSIAVSLEVQHVALVCLQKFSCLRIYHSLIYESDSRNQFYVLCLKCTSESNQIPLSLHISELSCQILTNLYLGDYAAGIREHKVNIAEADRFVRRSVLEIFDMLFSRLITDSNFVRSSFSIRHDSLIECALRFCAILAVDSSNHPKFWDANKPLAVTIAKNVHNFPHQCHIHVANMLKFVSSSIVNDSSRTYWSHLDHLDFQKCCLRVFKSMNQLIGPRTVIPIQLEAASGSCDAVITSSDSGPCNVPLSNVAVEEAVFCALMQFCRVDNFVDQFSLFCDSPRTLVSWVKSARSSSVLAMSFFLSAAINIIILDENCTITPKFLQAGLLSIPVFHRNLKAINHDSSLYLKVAKCIFRTLSKNNDMIMDLVLESECIETLVLFIYNMNVSKEDVRMQNTAKTVCSCFRLLCKNPIALIRLVTFGTGGCVPLLIEFFIPNANYEMRIECFQAIIEILTECRAIIEIDAVLLDKESQYLCFSESILGIVLSFLSKQEVTRSSTQKQQEYVFQCLVNLCALTTSNHEILLRLILENSFHRDHFYESLCNSQADDPSRIPSLQLVAELVKLNNDISNMEAMRPEILKFTIDVFEHATFQRNVVSELIRIDLSSELALLFVRLIHLFTSTESISHSVRRIYWSVIRGVLDSAQSNIVVITKRMRTSDGLMIVTSKMLAENEEKLLRNEEKLVYICTYALRNMSVQMSRSPHAHESGKDAFPVVVLLFQEPSPCRLLALQIVSILTSQFAQDSEFLRTIVEVPDKKNSILGKVAEVFCDALLLFDERQACIKFFAKCGTNREVCGVIYDVLMDPKAEKGNFLSLLPSLSPNLNPDIILDTLSIIHMVVLSKIEQGSLLDVRDIFCNSNLVYALAQLILPFESAIGLKSVEVLSDIMDPKPFELQLENIASSEKLIHLWPHFVSAVSTNAKSSPERLIKSICKILMSRISMRDAKCLTYQSEPYWFLNAAEILSVIQSSNSNVYCLEQKCVVLWSLRRLITISAYNSSPASSLSSCVSKETNNSIFSICVAGIISFLIGTICMVTESNRHSRSGSFILHDYVIEHSAFVLMHISCHLCNTDQSFQRNIVVTLVNILLSCEGDLEVSNFECYILACLHHVVLTSDQKKQFLDTDFENSTFWERIMNRLKFFATVPNGNGNDLLLLVPGFSCSRIVLGLVDGLCNHYRSNPHFLQRHLSIPFGEISKYMTSADSAERQHAISILCKLARMSNLVPEIMATFWKHPSASEFVQSIQEMLDCGETVAEREHACGFIYFSSKHPQEHSECWDKMFENMCQIILGPNRCYETIARCVFSPHLSISITALNCLINFSSSLLSVTFPHSQLLITTFLQDSPLFNCLSAIEHQPSSEVFTQVLKEEFKLETEHEEFVRFFARKTLQFFLYTSSIPELVQCFIHEGVIKFIVKFFEKSTEQSASLSSFVVKAVLNSTQFNSVLVDINVENSLQLESMMQSINIILNLCKFGDAGMLATIVNAGLTTLLMDILKVETVPAEMISHCLNALSQVAHIQEAKGLIQRDNEFLSRLSEFLSFTGGFKRLGNTLYVLMLLRKITEIPIVRDFFLSKSVSVDIFQTILEIFQRDFEETKLQALGVLSNLVSNDRIRDLLPNTNFFELNINVIRHHATDEHLKLSLISFINACCNCPSNVALVTALPGLIEDLCKYYLDPMVNDGIKEALSELLILLSNSSSTVSLPGALYSKYLSARPEAFIHLLCRIVCFQACNVGATKLASLELLYITSMKSSNVSFVSNCMIEECRNQSEEAPRPHSTFENLVIFLASTISIERELAASIFSGVAKVSSWPNYFAVYRSHIQLHDSSSIVHPLDTSVSPNPLIPLLLHSAAQHQFQKEASEAISALASLSDYEEYLGQISAHESTFDRLVTVLKSDNSEASIKSSHLFCNLSLCSKTQPVLASNQSIILSLAEIFPHNISSDDPRLRNIIKCFHSLSKSKDLDQLLGLCQNRVLQLLVSLFGGDHSFQISEILLNLCRSFSLHPDILDQVVCAGAIISLITFITNMMSNCFEPKIFHNCFLILNILKSIPGVVSQFFHNLSFIEMVCRSIYSKNREFQAAILLLDLSANEEHRHRLFRCIKFVTDACKFLLRSNMQKQDGIPASDAEETCIGANVLSNIAADFCHLEDFSSFFNYFPEHMWYQQNFMASADSQAPNAQVQECCTRAIFSLCEGETECFEINQLACANSCLTQLYGLLENGATNSAKINSARSLCAITSLHKNAEIRTLLANKISPAQLWHVPLLIIRERNPENAVRYCLGLICHLVEDPGRGAALAMVPVEKLGGAIRHIEWTLFKSLNHEDLIERLYAMRIMAAICVEQLSERITAISTDVSTGDVSRRVMKSTFGIGVFYKLIVQFLASSQEQEKERICMIFERFSVSPEFESQLRAHDPECSFFLDCVKSENRIISTSGCSIIKNACKSASLMSFISTNEDLFSAMCVHIESDDVRTKHVLQTLVQLACVGNFRHLSIFDEADVLGSLVRLLASNKRDFRESSCRLLLAVSDINDLGPRNLIIIRASALPHLAAIIKDVSFIESKCPIMLFSKLSSFPETQSFLHKSFVHEDFLFLKEMAMKVSHGRGADPSLEKTQIALAALSCIAKVTRDFSSPNTAPTRIEQPLIVQSRSFVADFFKCSQIMSSARECIDIHIDSETYDSHIFAFTNYAMEIFYNMSKLESCHKELIDPRHQLLPTWCKFFNHIRSPGSAVVVSSPILHLQYVLLILCNLMQSRTCPLEPFAVYSVSTTFPKQLEMILNRYCLAVDDRMDIIPPLKCVTLSVLQLFVQDRQTRKLLIESERTEATSFVTFFCKHLSRKRSSLPNIDSVTESMLNIICTLTTSTEHLPVLIKCISSTGRDVLLEYMRYASQASTTMLVLKCLLNMSRCSDKESFTTLSEAGGMKHLTEWLFNYMFKKPNASMLEVHVSISTLFNLRHLMKLDPSTKGFLLHPREKEYRDKVILTSRTVHSDPIGASVRLICLKFLSFLLHICELESNTRCYDNISFKLLADREDQASSGFCIQSLIDIAMLSDIHTLSFDDEHTFDMSQVDLMGQVVQFPCDYLLSDIDRPLMEGTTDRLAEIEKGISQHSCCVLCTIFCNIQPTLIEQLFLSGSGSKMYLPIISHIREGSSFPVIVLGCKALASLSKNALITESFSDPAIITTLLTLLDRLPVSTVSHNVLDDIMTAIIGFSKNLKCVPYCLSDVYWDKQSVSHGGISWRNKTTGETRLFKSGGVWMVGILSRWFTSCRQMQLKQATLSIIEQITRVSTPAFHASDEDDFDALLVAVAENPNFGLVFICAQLDSSSESPFSNCLNILCNILASSNVREMVTAPTSFYNCTDILGRLIHSNELKSKAALSCLTFLCRDSDLQCKLINPELIKLIMDRILNSIGHGKQDFHQSNVEALQLLQFVFRTRDLVFTMFTEFPQFFENIISLAHTDQDVFSTQHTDVRHHTSRLILSICCAEVPDVFEVFMRKDICSFVSSLRDSQSEHCAAIATQIACKLLSSRSIVLQVEQRVRLFCALQCGIFTRFECNWPTQQAPTTFKCAIEGADSENGVDFSCVAQPGGHYNIQSTKELILVHHNSVLGSVYCVITVALHPSMHVFLLQYRDAISQYFSGGPSSVTSVDLQGSMRSFVNYVAEISYSTQLGANLLFVAVTPEHMLWSSISSISGVANHKLFLLSAVRCLDSKFETAIGSATLCLLDRPANRSFFVIGSEGFCRFMSDSQVADAINVLPPESPSVKSGSSMRMCGEFLSVARDLVNISDLGRVNSVGADDEQIPECSCILLHLHRR